MRKSDLSPGNGAELAPNNVGTQGIAEQRYRAFMQKRQDKQQTNDIYCGIVNDNASCVHQGPPPSGLGS